MLEIGDKNNNKKLSGHCHFGYIFCIPCPF
jgi:hypothetical protein